MPHILLVLLRPLVIGIVVILVGIFGRKFLKRLLNGVSIFLGIITAGGIYISVKAVSNLIEYGSYASSDDIAKAIIAVIMTACFLFFTVLYGFLAMTSDEKTTEGEKGSKARKIVQKILNTVLEFLFPLCLMGFSLPFFFMEEPAGKVVGTIIEAIGIFICVLIARKNLRKKNEEKENIQ